MTKKNDEFDEELSTIPNLKYQKFFAKFAEVETLEVSQWKIVHLLAYFAKRYQAAYRVSYSWKFNNPNPNKSFEVWQMNTLVAKLSSNPKILKEYIDWAFTTLVPQAKRRLTSISFMTKDEVVNPYKMNILLGGKKDLDVDRSTLLPFEYRDILGHNGLLSVVSYGDLAFICQIDPRPNNLATALVKMSEGGFEMEILKRIV